MTSNYQKPADFTTNHDNCSENLEGSNHELRITSGDMKAFCIWCGRDWKPEWDE